MESRRDLDERKGSILRALISLYVRSGEPVGSKTLVERYRLEVSPATVRNEMGVLEDGGFIYQPHTSAGRIPTDAGYRYFVDTWTGSARLPAEQARRVRVFFGEPRWELEEALRQTATLLSSITDHAAVVFAPALDRSVIRHVELVGLTNQRAMFVVVTDTGRVENHVISLSAPIDDVQLEQASEMLNRIAVGVALDDAVDTLKDAVDRFPLELREVVENALGAMGRGLADKGHNRVYLEGTSTIVDEQKFQDLESVREVIGALEHRRLLLEVLADALSAETVSVRIGSENSVREMQHCSVIAAPYGSPGHPIGSLGIVGPTRMDYKRTIAAVDEVAANLGRMFSDLGI